MVANNANDFNSTVKAMPFKNGNSRSYYFLNTPKKIKRRFKGSNDQANSSLSISIL